MKSNVKPNNITGRLQSVDFFRGFTMFILVSGIGGIFHVAADADQGGAIIAFLGKQFRHGEWHELYFWDLIQPFFMFIVGVVMPFSYVNRVLKGQSHKKIVLHALKRSLWFLVLGFMLGATETSYRLTDILPQLSFVYIVAFLIMQRAIKWQLIISFAMILLSYLLYTYWPVEGFNQPYTPDHNFGSWFDLATVGHLHSRHWVTFNAIPTTAHTIWGVVVGRLLLSEKSKNLKVMIMIISGAIGVAAGHLMNAHIPIIERICTPSYIFVTGGWALIAMGVSYWLIDVLNFKKPIAFFAIMGMNPIFIYIFSSLGGKHLLTRMAKPFTYRMFSWSGNMITEMVTIAVVAAMMWYICYFLYKRKVFIKI